MLTLLFLKATIVLGGTVFGAYLCRRASAAVRHGIWVAGLALLLALPFLSYSVPVWSIEVLARSVTALAPPADEPVVVPGSAKASVDPGLEVAIQQLSPLAVQQPRIGPPAPLAAMRPWHLRSDVRFGILLVWAAGVLFIFGRFASNLRRLQRLACSSSPLDPEMEQLLEGVRREVGLRKMPRCGLSWSVMVPVTWGNIRPAVLLPAVARGWSRDRLRGVLLHELSHIRRRDWISHLLTQVASAAYWPNPLVWHAVRSARVQQEQACDDAVLRHGLRGTEYATHLFEIAQAALGHRLAAGGLAFAGQSALRTRVMAILTPTLRRGAAGVWTVVGIMLGAAGFGVPIAGWESVDGGRFAALEYDLIDDLDAESPAIRIDAARSLGALGSTRAIPILVHALTDPNRRVRESAVASLERISNGRVVTQIVEGLEATSIDTRGGSARAVRSLLGSGGLSGGSMVRHRLAQALADRTMHDSSAEIRALAVGYLAGLCDDTAVEAILIALDDHEAQVRTQALRAAIESMHLDRRLEAAVRERQDDCGPHPARPEPPSSDALARLA